MSLTFVGADRIPKDALSSISTHFKSTTFLQELGTNMGAAMGNFGINNTSPATPSGLQSNVNTGVGVRVS